MTIIIRLLTSDDTASYRELRQRILRSEDARYFSDSYERERQLDDLQWREWCTEKPEHCIIGTFDDHKLVGVIMITRQGDKGSPIVEWEAAWLDPAYRGKGLGKAAYRRAQTWSEARGYKYVVGFIRETYTPALDICRDLGFVDTYIIRGELWADGSVDDVRTLILDLRSDAYRYRTAPVLQRFKDAMPFLIQGQHPPQMEQGVMAV